MREAVDQIDSRAKLFLSSNPYDLEGTEEIFLDAVRNNIRFHKNNCRDYARILSVSGYDCRRLRRIGDLADIPVIPTLYLKRHPVSSVPHSKLATVASSSGTGGLKSRIGIDRRSLIYGLCMTERIFRYHGLVSVRPVNYAVLGYKPSGNSGNPAGAARTLYGATKFAPGVHRAYAVKQKGEKYETDTEAFLRALFFYERAGFPVRMMGFPSYLSFLLDYLEQHDIRLQFATGSKVILGGGWKTSERDKISREELYGKTRKYLGIGEEACYEFFSAVEHPVSYCCCRNHHFHVPIYSRVIVRDTATLKPLPYGEPGLMSFVTPLLGSAPCVSVMTDDIGVLHDGRSCGCRIQSPYFEILGRIEDTGIRTCAVQAFEHLTGGRTDGVGSQGEL